MGSFLELSGSTSCFIFQEKTNSNFTGLTYYEEDSPNYPSLLIIPYFFILKGNRKVRNEF